MKAFNLRAGLDVLTSLFLISAASTLVYKNVFAPNAEAREVAVPSKPLSIAGLPTRGSAEAPAVMIVYSDFQCPYCGRFAREVLPEIDRRYIASERVSLVFRHLPLTSHPQAMRAAWNAECARQQGRFWEMHDALFAQSRLDEESLLTLPDTLALDRKKFADCLADESVRKKVQTSVEDANGLGVRATPTIFFGERMSDGNVRVSSTISGALPAEEFAKRLDAILGHIRTGWISWLPFVG